ncbi:hypothetical protein K438DRAFT_1993359 [Mycena galopus ATCC 62051]|nr:hypothetical protein K438DRAFT_1993359 [Mycena galopus ATCC 62051]
MFLEMMSCFGFTPRWLDLPSGGAGRTVGALWGIKWWCEVAYLLVLEMLNTGFDMQMYQPLILKYNQVLDYFPTVFDFLHFLSRGLSTYLLFENTVLLAPPPAPLLVHSKLKLQTKTTYAHPEPLCVVLVSTATQLFFAWLICTFTCVRAAPVLIALFAGAAFGESSLVVVYQFFGGGGGEWSTGMGKAEEECRYAENRRREARRRASRAPRAGTVVCGVAWRVVSRRRVRPGLPMREDADAFSWVPDPGAAMDLCGQNARDDG